LHEAKTTTINFTRKLSQLCAPYICIESAAKKSVIWLGIFSIANNSNLFGAKMLETAR
jgi:hypothetical protein